MCGIAGIISTNNHKVSSELLLVMRQKIAHRGPDDAGLWIDSDSRIGLAHQRLAVIDLSPAGCQPMTNGDASLHIVFNGEIYNYRHIRSELEDRGHIFRTQTDTEVLLQAYKQWGTDCLSKLNGMFAFAIWDANRRRLFMARDRAGKKPLYYWKSGGLFAFASEARALLPVTGSLSIDSRALNLYFAFGYVPGDISIFSGIRKLLPGHFLTYDPGKDELRTGPYWRPPLLQGIINSNGSNEEELVTELYELLRDSVSLRMISDVPLGILLSGGVDSSLITAVAAELSERPVKTFTIGFPGSGRYDETSYASVVAKHFGTEHHLLSLQMPDNIELLVEVASKVDEPLADPSILPTYLISQLTRRNVTVALGGDGGDELFGGYPWYQRGLQFERTMERVPRTARKTLAAAAGWLPVGFKGRSGLMARSEDLRHFAAYGKSLFDPLSRRKLLSPDITAALSPGHLHEPEGYRMSHWLRDGDGALRMSYLDFKTYLPDDILFKVDRASMAFALEVRAPWLDFRIIEFAFGNVPSQLKVTVHGLRHLQKKLARRLLPSTLDLERKQGFVMPIEGWMRDKWGELTIESVREGNASHYIDYEFVNSMVRGQRRGLNNGVRLFACLLFALWLESL